MAARGRTLLSLTSNRVSLEQIFLRLTEAADNDEAKRLLGINEEPQKEKVNIELDGGNTVTVKTGNDTEEAK